MAPSEAMDSEFMVDFIMDPQGDTIITLSNPRPPVLPRLLARLLELPETNPGLVSNVASLDMGLARDMDAASKFRVNGSTPYTFLVSSAHLALASPVFKEALTASGWREGNKVKTDLFKIETSTVFELQAFSIILNLIHGRDGQVPDTVSLETLAAIAVVADYYGVEERVKFAYRSWVAHLTAVRTTAAYFDFADVKRDWFLWIAIAWVFQAGTLFEKATRGAALQATSDLKQLVPDDLPIPPSVIDQLDKKRQAVITSVASNILALRDNYFRGSKGCDYECRCFLGGAVGILAERINASGSPPCAGKSLRGVVHSLRGISELGWPFKPSEIGMRANLPHDCSWDGYKGDVKTVGDLEEAFGLADEIVLGNEKRKRTGSQARGHLLDALLGSIVTGSGIKTMGLKLKDFTRQRGSQGTGTVRGPLARSRVKVETST